MGRRAGLGVLRKKTFLAFVIEVRTLGTVKFFRQTQVFVMQGFCLTNAALYTCVCVWAMEVASSAGDFSVRSIQHHQRGHHLIIIRTNGRTDRQNKEMVIMGGGAQILHGNYTQRWPRHATSKGLCWQTRTCDQHVGLCCTDACSCLQRFYVIIPSLLGGGRGGVTYHA